MRDKIVSFRATSAPLRSSPGWGSYASCHFMLQTWLPPLTVYPFALATCTMDENEGPPSSPLEYSLKM